MNEDRKPCWRCIFFERGQLTLGDGDYCWFHSIEFIGTKEGCEWWASKETTLNNLKNLMKLAGGQ